MKKTYILVMRDINYHLVGPFDSDNDAVVWSKSRWDCQKGDPRWQVLDLTYDPTIGFPQVFDPSVATKEHI